MSPNLTMADILTHSFDSFLESSGPQPLLHHKVASAIRACRTPLLGGQREQCDHCGTELLRFHSCRNRHCPRCQTTARLNWVSNRLDEILPVGYFHVVFTIPSQLNQFALRNKKAFYNLMFLAVKETVLQLALDQKHLGADIGFLAVLHTWGQTLVHHPHIHCIVPGGGFDSKRQHWKPTRREFLFPIPVVSKLFRGKLMAFFRDAVADGSIALHGELQRYGDAREMKLLIDQLYRKDWVIYIKQPFASAKALVRYLGAYTHRVAIADSRIKRFQNDQVSFTWKDYSDHNRTKLMSLAATEFIRRFMFHVLPSGFKRIRYYGFLAPRARQKRLNRCRAFFRKPPLAAKKNVRPWYETVKELTGRDPLRCLVCGLGRLRRIDILPPTELSTGMAKSG